jgi:GT2 family glycosyltransferase
MDVKSSPLVSITLPSVRPDLVEQRIKDYERTCADINYELIIVSSFVVEGPNVIHVPEHTRLGATGAQHEAYDHASGQYVVWMSDDAVPTPGCIKNIVEFVSGKREPFIAAFRVRNAANHFRERAQAAIYGKLFACWGCASRGTIEQIGGFFDTVYFATHTDVDQSLRCWNSGGEVLTCPSAWMVWDDADDELKSRAYLSKWEERDGAIFRARWDPVFGKYSWRPTWQGAQTSPLSFRQHPTHFLFWTVRLVPTRIGLLFRMARINLYPLVCRTPFYNAFQRLKANRKL